MKWCARCVLPDTRPNLRIAEDGVCNACRAHGTKREIDWDARQKALLQVVTRARGHARGHDCLIPVSGGKDSTWQVVKCLEYGLTPLAVTWKTPARTAIGQRNLDNLVSLGVDHIDYQVNPKVEARFMVAAFERFGSTAIPMHMALFNIPMLMAERLRIPLVVWGENSAFEYGSNDEALTGFRLNAAWLAKYGVTHGTTVEDWVGAGFTAKELAAYFGPDHHALETHDIRAIFLGYYLPWDPETSLSVARANGFSFKPGEARTGYYDYADIDDDFISLHHWMKWYKFGFTRLFDNLSLEIRNGRMSRQDALRMIAAAGEQTPHEDIERFCAFAGIARSRFFSIAEAFRNHDIWKRRSDGVWHIPGFITADWRWA
jgi:N-acetyl sugar amidotransferase